MRKLLIPLAAAASALAVAAPASAQVYGNLGVGYGAPAYGYGNGYGAPAYGYGNGYGAPAYGYGNGYGNGYGYQGIGQLEAQIQQIRYQMRNLSIQGRLTRGERRVLERDVFSTERMLQNARYRGVSPWEARALNQRIERLRYEVRRYADFDRRNRYGYGYGNGRRY